MILKDVWSVAKKEFLDNYRNRWVLVLSLIFVVLPLVSSYFSSQLIGWQDFSLTISNMRIAVEIFIPIIGLMLGYAAIVGEIEMGSLSSVLALPVNREEILLGKFLGLGSVICSTILIGFGISGIIIAVNVPNPDYGVYILYILVSILLGLAFLSVALLFSTIFRQRSTAMGGVIFLWVFFAVFWQLFLRVVLFVISGDILSQPSWLRTLDFFNPIAIHSMIGSPEFSPYLVVVSLLLWIMFPLIGTGLLFRKKDV